MLDSVLFQPIAVADSPYKEKFGIPRQAGLVNDIEVTIRLLPEFCSSDAVRGLEQYSHIWLLFLFSQSMTQGWSPTVRPPRLGGNKKLGVFATRSPFRPNPIGMSAVKLESIEISADSVELRVLGADLLDGTPILDIKPYLPYSDMLDKAQSSIMKRQIPLMQSVVFSPKADQACQLAQTRLQQPVKNQLIEILRCDPRPAYKKNNTEKIYGLQLYDMDISFSISNTEIVVRDIRLIVTES